MIKLNKQDIAAAGIVTFLITAAVACRIAIKMQLPLDSVFSFTRSAIYIGLFTAWGISVKRRIIQTQVRRYLIAISLLTIFWMLVRTLKYSYAVTPEQLRYLWYLYYLPQLFIPLLLLLITFLLRKPETYRLPKRTMLLYIPSAVFFLLVLTNDMHQMIFMFPKQPWSDHSNTYAPMFYILTFWEYACGIWALVVMWMKCRIAQSRKRIILPVILIFVLLAYQILYLSGAQWLRFFAGDATVVSLLCFIGILESCIRSGLIQSNTRYKELFYASTLNAVIADRDYNIMLSSENADNFGAVIL